MDIGDEEGDGVCDAEIGTRELVPRESDEAPADPPHQRHDAFNGAKKRAFLKVLAKTGCLLDACRAVGISHQTAYNHQASDRDFARYCDLALKMAATNVELMAWERGVEGIEEDRVYAGKVVGTRIKRSDSILRLLLQGADRKKYGPRPGFSRKRLLAHERKQIEREVRARIVAERPSIDEVSAKLVKQIKALTKASNDERRAAGWIELEECVWIPPGWVRADGSPNASEKEEASETSTFGHSM